MPRKRRHTWTDELVLSTLKTLHEKGVALNARSLRVSHVALYGAIHYRFGSLERAVRLAGIDYAVVKIAPRPRCQDALRAKLVMDIKKLADAGVDMSSRAIATQYPALSGRMRRSFGSHRNAIEEAGLEYATVRKRLPCKQWTRKRVIECIKMRARNGHALNMLTVSREDGPLYNAACRYFGNWGMAAAAAGFTELEVRADKQWNSGRIVSELRLRVARGDSLSLSEVRSHHPSLYDAAVRYFGCWRKAIRALDISYARVRKIRKWSKHAVVLEIRMFSKQGKPLSFKSVYRSSPILISRALFYWGSWEAAVEAAGFNYRHVCLLYRTKDIAKAGAERDRVAYLRALDSKAKSLRS